MTRRTPAQYNFDKLLFDERILTKHFTPQDSKDVRFIVIHHMAMKDYDPNKGDAIDAAYNTWQKRKASAHYVVDGRFIGQLVWDKDRAWATGSAEGNRYGISIEHVNKTGNEPGTDNDWVISDETWKNGAKLTAYLHKVYGLGMPVKNKTIRKHKTFTKTECPGPYFEKIWDDYCSEVVRIYKEITTPSHPVESSSTVPSRPADVIDMENFKWTDPNSREVKQPELSKMKSNQYCYVTADGRAVAFRSPVKGKTTENTHYTRSELRQTNGSTETSFNPSKVHSEIQAAYEITEQPVAKPDQVLLQIHDGKGDIMQVRHEGTHLFVTINGKFHETLDKNLKLHTKFYLRAISDDELGISVRYQKSGSAKVVQTKWKKVSGKKWFWKTGCYVQSNVEHGDKPSAAGEVLIYKNTLKVTTY